MKSSKIVYKIVISSTLIDKLNTCLTLVIQMKQQVTTFDIEFMRFLVSWITESTFGNSQFHINDISS